MTHRATRALAPTDRRSNGDRTMRFTRSIAAGLTLAIVAVSFAGTAEARHRHRHHHHHGDAAAAGIFGFAAGALLSGAFAQPRYRYYDEPIYVAPPPVIYQPGPVYYRAQPWTPEWYESCDRRYQSFNPNTGYFLGFDGDYHFCY
jgi:hypothetical protein